MHVCVTYLRVVMMLSPQRMLIDHPFLIYFAGDPDYYEVRNEFYKNADGVLLMFDVTHKTSFESLGNWLGEAAKFGLSSESAAIVVVGNKIDQYPREVTEQEVS